MSARADSFRQAGIEALSQAVKDCQEIRNDPHGAETHAIHCCTRVTLCKTCAVDAVGAAFEAENVRLSAEVERLKGERDELGEMEETRTQELQSAVSDLERVTKERDNVLRATSTYNNCGAEPSPTCDCGCNEIAEELAAEAPEPARPQAPPKDPMSGLWRCSACGEAKEDLPATSWRWTGGGWEHKCGDPQAGYFEARFFGPKDHAAALAKEGRGIDVEFAAHTDHAPRLRSITYCHSANILG